MRKRLFIGVFAFWLFVFAIWFLAPAASVEPTINGRTASGWIKALANSAEQDVARTNLTNLGTAGIPYIVAAIDHASSLPTKAYSKAAHISPAMRKLLAEPFPWNYVREDLAVILGRIGNAHSFSNETGDAPATPEINLAVEALRAGMREADTNYRRLCAHALWEVGPNARSATGELLKLFAEGTAHDKRLVCQGLGRIGVDESTASAVCTALMDALRSDDLNLKVPAIQALSGLDSAGAPAVPMLVRLLDHPHEVVRSPALRALARIGHLPAESRATILKFAEDKDDYTKAGAAIALLRINSQDAFAKNLALRCLGPEMPRTLRTSTLFLILGMHGDATIFAEELKGLARDPEPMVSKWARQALSKIERE
jgi:HEAT repeat protein